MAIDKIAVIGTGSWGTTIAFLLADKGYDVTIRGRRQEIVDSINNDKRNPVYLSDLVLPASLKATTDFEHATSKARVIVLVVPSHAIRETIKAVAAFINPGDRIISLAKGLEADTYLRMSQVITEELPDFMQGEIAVLSGPNHAEEVSKKIPSATVVSSSSMDTMNFFQDLFMTGYFRVYTNADTIGVEIGGASKNVIALATGMSDGLGYGDNAKASLMTRGLAEMSRLGENQGARLATFSGLAGMGDLIATCISKHSRNRGAGEMIAKGMTVEDISSASTMVVEGVTATKVIRGFAQRLKIELPITQNVYEVIYEDKEPIKCVRDLMERGPNTEL